MTTDKYFGQYVREWLEDCRRYIELSTWQGYEYVCRNHILPFFSDFKLNEITFYDIQRYVDLKIDSGLSPVTVKKHRAILHKMFEDACFYGLSVSNPCRHIRMPHMNKYRGNIYSVEELKQLLEVSTGHYLETPVRLAVYYGLRRSEVLGLKWSNVDFANGIIYVCHTVTNVQTLVARDGCKNDSSNRILPLIPSVRSYLGFLADNQSVQVSGCDEYICRKSDGAVITPNALSSGFSRLLSKHGMRHIRFHDLRHSNVSMLLNSGVDLKYISAWAGHSNISITADLYSHLDFTSKIKMGNKIDELLQGKVLE